MTFKMKGWSGYKNSPIKHTLPGNEVHVHDSSFDVSTPEDEFTKEDKRIYVTNKDKKVKEAKVIEEKKPKKKKKKRGGLKKWLKRNIRLRGGVKPRH